MEENQLQRISQTLHVITRINQAIFQIRQDPRKLLHEVCDILVEERGYTTIWIAEQRKTSLYPIAASSETIDNRDELQTWVTHSVYDQTIARQALREEQTIIASSQMMTDDAHTVPWDIAAVPIHVNGEMTAIINACANRPDTFDAAEIQLLEELAANIGFVLESQEADIRRIQAEEALRTSEERFRRLAEHSLVGIVLTQNNVFRYVNPALTRMFGYTDPAELIDRYGPLDLTAPESRDLVKENITRRLRGEVQALRYTFKGLRRDGTVFDVEVYGARAMHARKPAIISSVMDITEREKSRQQLEALSQAGLELSRVRTPHEAIQKAVESAPKIVSADAINIFLLKDQHLELAAHAGYRRLNVNVQSVTDSGIRITGLPTYKHMLTTRSPILIKDTTNSQYWTSLPGSAAIRSYLGTPLIARGEIIGFLNADGIRPGQFNITDAKHLQLFADYVAATIEHLRLIESLTVEHHRLSTLNALSQTLAETLELREVAKRALTHVGNALGGGQHSIVYLWNKLEKKLMIITEQGVIQSAFAIPDIESENVEQDLARWVINYRKISPPPYTTVLDIPLEVHGELIGILCVSGDKDVIFEEENQQLLKTLSVPIALALQNSQFYEAAAHQAKIMAEALKRQEELDQMKDELLQNISHELRTPLALVTGYTQMLRDGTLGDISSKQAEVIDIIARRSSMLRSLVENVTMHWQLDNPKDEFPLVEVVELGKFIRSVCEEFQNEARKASLALIAEVPEQPLIIKSATVQLHRLLDNLIGNAMKFTPAGGQITVNLEQDEAYIGLSVCDTGIGVPKEKLGQIFERFYQVDGSATRRFGGIGLGLALVKAIVESHQGTIWAESPVTDDPENPGTCILIRIPPANNIKSA